MTTLWGSSPRPSMVLGLTQPQALNKSYCLYPRMCFIAVAAPASVVVVVVVVVVVAVAVAVAVAVVVVRPPGTAVPDGLMFYP